MRHYLSALLSAIALLCITGTLSAQAPDFPFVDDPYEGRVPVQDQSDGTREAALRVALAQVLQRLANDPLPYDIEALTGSAAQLVQRYGYETDPETRQLQLVAGFDRHAVDAQLRALGGTTATPEADVRLSVLDIGDARGYADTLAALRRLSGVGAVRVVAAQGSQLDLQLRVRGGAVQLEEGLSSMAGWVAVPAPSGVQLAYRVNR